MNILGQRIKHLRESNKMNQLELAKILNISNTTLSQYESGQRIPSDDIKIRIADYFVVSTDYLLGRDDKPISNVTAALVDDPELQAFWDTMKERDDLQLMFKKTKELSPSAIKQIIGIIKLIEDREDEEFGE